MFALVIALLLALSLNVALDSQAADYHSHQTVPQSNSAFISDLQTFLKSEDPNRYSDLFAGTVVGGGVDTTGGTLTHTPTSLTAYPGGYYTTETGSVTYVSNSTCYLIVHRLTTGNLGTFQRQSGTHYLTDCTSPSKPALPTDALWLATVTTNGSSVTAYTDLRTRVPYAGSYPLADIPTVGVRGRLVLITDVGSGTLYWDNGSAWKQLALNPMTQAGDLVVGGSSGIPSRFALGTANQFLGVDSSAAAPEYKTLAGGDGISISHSTGGVTITATAASPSGSVVMYVGSTPPTGWLLCDGTAYNASTYPSMTAALIGAASSWGRGTAVGTFTVDAGTDIVTLAAHGLTTGSLVHVASTTTLPAGLSANTIYYVRDETSSTFKLAATSGGTAINITSTGSGTHSLYNQIQVPNFNSRAPFGVGTGVATFTFASADVNTGTEVITVPSNTTMYTGDAVTLTCTGCPTGLTTATTYYVIRLTATTIQLASSRANALDATAVPVNITVAGSGTLSATLTARSLGEAGGQESHWQTQTEVGRHQHNVTVNDSSTFGTSKVAGNNGTGANGTASNATALNTSPTDAMNVMPPYIGINFIIKQ